MNKELETMSDTELKELERDLKEEAFTVEAVKEALEKNEDGKVRQTLDNCVFVLEHDPVMKGAICRNELNCRIEITKDMPWKRQGNPIMDTDEMNIRLYLERNYGLTSKEKVETAISIVANEHRFHPIRELLESLVWDGIPRIKYALNHFLGAPVDRYTEEVMTMHMLAAISRVYEPGCKYDIALCLVGSQGCGKSTFFRFLAIKDQWFTDDLHKIDDPKVFEKMNGHWIVELGEMGALVRAKSLEDMKSFITRQCETFRTPYAKHPEHHDRQVVFCGTSNDMQFLPFDRTGNRRFAPVSVNPALAEQHILSDEKASREYFHQMWAEAMVMYREGNFKLTFSKEMEEYAQEMQKEFMPEDTELGLVENYLETMGLKRTCVKEIYCKVFGHCITEEMPNWMSKKITEILRSMGWQDIGSRKFGEYGSQKAWEPEAGSGKAQPDEGFVPVSNPSEIPFLQ
ncbi:MAG: virulence-associated protein E [Oribacterium sp.]|nr:virulence-associated protein E [Oribacterium sp.]